MSPTRILAAVLSAQLVASLSANTSPIEESWIAVEGKVGGERSLVRSNIFAPLWAEDGAMLYLDLRGVVSDADTEEGNFGLGYRRTIDDLGILGLYGYYDVQSTANDTLFHQATLGTEWLTRNWELRLNTYIPLSEKELIGYSNLTDFRLELTPSRVAVTADATALYEEPLWGADIEAGYTWRLADYGFERIGLKNWEVRALAGAFFFHGDHSGSFAGPMARLETNWRDPFGLRGWVFSLGAEGRSGNGDMDEFYLTAGLSVPLGRMLRGSTPTVAPGSLAGRMLMPVRRDVDVLTNVVEVDESVSGNVYNRAGFKLEGANFYSNVASGVGNGTYENPETLEEAVASGENRLLVGIDAGNGTIETNSVQLMNGQILAGASHQVTGLRTDATGDLVSFDAYPTPTGAAIDSPTIMLDISNGHLIELANNNQLNGLTLAGNALATSATPDEGDPGYTYLDEFAQILAAGSGIKNLWVTNNPDTFKDVQGAGVALYNATGTVLVEGSSFRDSDYGIVVFGDTALPDSILVQDNTFADLDRAGVRLIVDGITSMAGNVTIANNSFTNIGDSATELFIDDALSLKGTITGNMLDTATESLLYVDASDSQSLTLAITDNTAINGEDSAVYVETDGTQMVDLTIAGNSISDYAGGIYLEISDAMSVNMSLTANSVTSTDEQAGIDVRLGNTDTAKVSMRANTVTNAESDGIHLESNDVGTLGVTIASNMVEDADVDGIYVELDTTETANVSLTGNTVTGSGEDGIDLNTDDVDTLTATIASNTVKDTSVDGIYLDIDTGDRATLSLTGNTVTGSGEDGIDVSTDNVETVDITVTSNMVEDASVDGIYLDIDTSDVVNVSLTGNTVTDAGEDGIDLNTDDINTLTAAITGNTVDDVSANGIRFGAEGEAAGSVTVSSNKVSNTDDDGLDFTIEDDAMITATIASNTVTGSAEAGIDLETYDDASLNATLTGNTVNVADNAGVDIDMYDDSVMDVTIQSLTTTSTAGAAVSAILDDDTSLTISVTDSTLDKSNLSTTNANGIDLDASATSGNIGATISGNTIKNVPGIGVHKSGDVTATNDVAADNTYDNVSTDTDF